MKKVNGFLIDSFYEGLSAYTAVDSRNPDGPFFKCYSLESLAKHIGISPDELEGIDF